MSDYLMRHVVLMVVDVYIEILLLKIISIAILSYLKLKGAMNISTNYDVLRMHIRSIGLIILS